MNSRLLVLARTRELVPLLAATLSAQQFDIHVASPDGDSVLIAERLQPAVVCLEFASSPIAGSPSADLDETVRLARQLRSGCGALRFIFGVVEAMPKACDFPADGIDAFMLRATIEALAGRLGKNRAAARTTKSRNPALPLVRANWLEYFRPKSLTLEWSSRSNLIRNQMERCTWA